jgi:2-C-methyl-D-erythritol 4-phosphate cytidylyltransferase
LTVDHPPHFGAVIVAAGASTRFQSGSKVLAQLNGRSVLHYSLDIFTKLGAAHIVVVLGPDSRAAGEALVQEYSPQIVTTCAGGDTRTDSVRAGLDALPPEIELVAVHDAARPLASEALARRVIDEASGTGAAVPAIPVADTVVEVGERPQVETVLDRSRLRAVQTPQAFRRDWLVRCLASAETFTDEGSAMVAAGYKVSVVDGDPLNMKITWPLDLAIAEAILRDRERG